ncbi:Xaa-Pro aminopeptidase [Caviibacterium pharyngocola]|uniref:Xaa-Pro aminopeptidase n=1 Tax=Caviibacterium pharyngocola TaxID=28159 RepID=A0A2M8RWE7_9PAST|nr:Xaa-Pro aminopeptidase [Caviibacterium pharyngocola]PJG83204.1 Xaa-Pro aminopeptidase [Caviibacterium pharyngocola]
MDLAYKANIPAQEFILRRQAVFAQIKDNSAVLIFSAQEKIRSNDCAYPFRQDSYFWYLTGFNEPDSALLLIKRQGELQTHLFLRPSDPLMETWNGRRLGVEKAPTKLTVDFAYPIETFGEKLAELSENLTALYYKREQQQWGDALLEQSAVHFSQSFCWAPILDEMRLFKSPNEIALMQQAGQISALAHIRAMRETRPNRAEYEIENELLYEFNRFGARYAAYNSIVAGGENACILHYTENDQVLKDGDLVLIDAGCEFAMYAGDITRTFPVNGKFTQAQKEIYQLVLQAQKHAISRLVPGANIQQVSDEIIRIKTEGLVRLGILTGEVDELIAQQAYRRFYMHGLGHWLGLDVHDVGSYTKDAQDGDRNGKRRDRPLQVGMVLTVEPGLYISSDADLPEQYKGIGIRIEDNILITEYGNKILTSAVPKEIEDIERLMA